MSSKRKTIDLPLVVDFTVDPVAASRPRVSRWGTYYEEPYRSWKKTTGKLFEAYFENHEVIERRGLCFGLVCSVRQPKTTKLDDPNGDIDNYAKAVMDALNGTLWVDDKQISTGLIHKRWADKEEDGTVRLFVGHTDDHLKELFKWFTKSIR